jgi:membrane peptidoglycan carboxypeptidase
MALVDVVWERLARLNPPRRKRHYAWHLPVLRAIAVLRWGTLIMGIALVACGALYEMRTSRFEAAFLTRLDRGMSTKVEAGPSPSVVYPKTGPYDERFGYAELPQFVSDLTVNGYAVADQARWSPELGRFVGHGAFAIYREKDRAGLSIFDRVGDEVYRARFPDATYRDFASIPPLVVNSLLFIEDRYLFDQKYPEHNAAIEWARFGEAAGGRILRVIVPHINEGGGSTLATQIEKFRHSPGGQTGGVGDKMRQMLTASARMYMDGRDTMARRKEVVTTYLNSTPLASMPGYGEVIGLPEALRVWFGTDYAAAAQVLNETPRDANEWARRGRVYREALALILSERRPSYYLVTNHDALDALTDKYLHALSDAGVIEPRLRDSALAAHLHFRDHPPAVDAGSYVRQKATEDTRNKLVSLLKLPDLYSLDRLDLTADTTLDTAAQARVTAILQKLSDPAFLRASGMVGKQLLSPSDPAAKVTYSFVLYEHGANANYLRIRADSANKPFDINSGGKLMLGSTAKLRTLATYLEIISDLHQRFAGQQPRELLRVAAGAQDPLTQWAATYMAHAADRRLQPMLDAAMQRHYSAAPGAFFTGGGTQGFGNFESTENGGDYPLTLAFQHSINLVYVRLLKDIVTYYNAQSGVELSRLLSDPNDPNREAYLQRFADADGRRFLYRYYKDLRGLTPEQMLEQMARRARPAVGPLTTIYLSMYPDGRFANFQNFITTHLPREDITQDDLWHAYVTDTPYRLSLKDRGYVAGVHPLELWLATYLQDHPDATWEQLVSASADTRQEVYSWLFKGSLYKQDERIKILLEQDGFGQLLDQWRLLGYPFAHLVPSLGTVLGASGDRPDALAELMGIILNDGTKLPMSSIDKLSFAQGTPYETTLVRSAEPAHVMPPEVAQTLRRTLTGVVADGTASRLVGAYKAKDGELMPVGGKTGTGDNRFDRFAAGGGITSSRAVDRTATFVFFLGDRFFGTVTAYAPGPDAGRFTFTSALAVQLLRVLEPELKPLLDTPDATAQAGAASPS